MHKDYFADRLTHSPNIFCHRYRMRRSFLCFYFGEGLCPECVFCSEKGCRWLVGIVFAPESDRCVADASTRSVCRCNGRLFPDE
jgi:hypothetical protein